MYSFLMFKNLLKKLRFRKEELRILVPKDLDREGYVGPTKDFHKYSETFKRGEITAEFNKKKVRYWKQVWLGEKREEDRFVPIYWKVAEKRKDKSLSDF